MTKVVLNGHEYEVQRPNFAKGMRVITLVNHVQRLVGDLDRAMADFVRGFREANTEELDRVQAKLRYGGEIPVYGSDDEPLLVDGRPVTTAAPIESLTERDWEQANHLLRRPKDPPFSAVVMHVFPMVAEQAEEPLRRLLMLAVMDNDEFVRWARDKTWIEHADRMAEDVLDPADLAEVLELAVVAAEVVEGQVRDKLLELGERVGNVLSRLRPAAPTSSADEPTEPSESDETSNSSPSDSSTPGSPPSPTATAGTPSGSGDSPGTSSSTSGSTGSDSETQTKSIEAAARA